MNPILAPLLFNIFINDVAECALSKDVNDIKRGGVADVRVSGLCCHPEGPQQLEKQTQESHEVQQGEVKNSSLGEEQLQAAIHSGGCTAGKQVGRKSPGDPSGHQAGYEPEMCPCCKGNETYSGLDWANYCQEDRHKSRFMPCMLKISSTS